MKTLRLICTYECNRNCIGCCNKQSQFNPDKIVTIDESDIHNVVDPYNQVILTGGEPMLFPERLEKIIRRIEWAGCVDVIVYTAMSSMSMDQFMRLVMIIDGLTITLHNQKDSNDFIKLWKKVRNIPSDFEYLVDTTILRLNIFKGVTIPKKQLDSLDEAGWRRKENIEWIEDCPLPENETILRLEELWK